MDQFPSNTQLSRPVSVREVAKPAKEAPAEKEAVEKVVSGDVVRRKKPLGKRIKELFIGGDAQSVGQYIFMKVLVPAAQETIADAVSQGVERLVFGESRSSSRRTGARPGGGQNGYVNYNRYSPGSSSRREREDPRQNISRRARSNHDFDEIILGTLAEAEMVLDRLFDLLERYNQVTLSDFYDLCGITPQFTDEKYGWRELRGADVTRVRNGYLLDLPKPEFLD